MSQQREKFPLGSVSFVFVDLINMFSSSRAWSKETETPSASRILERWRQSLLISV
jgi:hypothetical protein